MQRKPHPVLLFIAAVVIGALVAAAGFRLLPEAVKGRRLLNALAGGHTTRARLIVLLGANPNFNTGHGSAMHYAAATGDIDLLRFLVLNGAKIDEPGDFGVTPLYLARLKGHPDVERFLIARGANPDTSRFKLE